MNAGMCPGFTDKRFRICVQEGLVNLYWMLE